MKKSTKIFASRFIIIALSIIAQAVGFWFIVFVLNQMFWIAELLTAAIGVVLFFSIVNREQAAVYKIPWIILFLIFPFAGVMVYITFGNVKMSRRQIRKFRHIYNERNDEYYDQASAFENLRLAGDKGYGMARYLHSVTSLPVYDDSYSEYLATGEAFFEKMKEQLSLAEKYVFLEYFIMEEGTMWDAVYEILLDRLKNGVRVYILYDDVGSMQRLPSRFDKDLRTEGFYAAKFNKFRPVVSISHNNRDHRKIAVIDGKAGFISGANIADEYINAAHPLGEWRDNGVFMKGRVVDSLVRLFIQMYNMSASPELLEDEFIVGRHDAYTDGFVMPFGDCPAPVLSEHVGENLYLDMIERSDKYLYITTPYLIVDTNVTEALKRAAKRGVDVRIILPEIPDKKLVYIMTRSFCPSLIAAGVKIYRFKGGFIHSKTFLSDGDTAVVGTINLDYRSLVHHFECAVWLYKTSSINDLYADFINLFDNKCTRVTEGEAKLKWYESLVKSVLNLFAPLM